MMTGYSGTALIKKLGIKPAMKLWLINQPVNYPVLLGEDISQQVCKKKEMADLIHLFAKSMKEFETEMKKLLPILKKNPALIIWVSWYKKSAGISTDLTENGIRDYALLNGLVDIKVCAVDEYWSALKLVVPLRNR